MQSPGSKEASQECLNVCCPSPFLGMSEQQKTIAKPRNTSATCRHAFVEKTTSSIFPNTRFTNHESLPFLHESFTEFTKTYPQYLHTSQVDQIRIKEYYHLLLARYTCLDYMGIGLFSYSQLQNHDSTTYQTGSSSSSSSSPVALPSPLQMSNSPFFGVSCKTGNLKTRLLQRGQESRVESAMKKKIMSFLKISENDYSMVFTTNRTSAFKLLAESYPFQSNRKLLTVYDYESEAVDAMINCSKDKGARIMSAEFSWPRMGIHSAKLRKMLESKRNKTKKTGLFAFPLHSRITGARYPYLWMGKAQENGWHVLIDACALGPKDMDSFGLSIYHPDFLICSFYKVFAENPSGFGCLFVKKSTIPVLEASTSSGMLSLVQTEKLFHLVDTCTGRKLGKICESKLEEDESLTSSSFSGPRSVETHRAGGLELEEDTEIQDGEDIAKLQGLESFESGQYANSKENGRLEIECRGLDQVDSLGLMMISSRSRCLINWLVNALTKLRHPNIQATLLVKIYGPKIKFDRGPAIAFNVFDSNGKEVEPLLVQKLADQNSISLGSGVLHHIWFKDKYRDEKVRLTKKNEDKAKGISKNKIKDDTEPRINVLTAALGFLANFEDVYRLWAFVALFLEADFMEKERRDHENH